MSVNELSVASAGADFAQQNRACVLEGEDGRWLFAIATRTRAPAPARRGTVVVVPPYGVNCHELFLFGQYLVENGFDVVRFDAVDNVGLSSGTIEQYTLGQLERDVAQVVRAFLPAADDGFTLLTQSLSFPVALKYSARDERVRKIVSVVGVVDVRGTVERVMRYSLQEYVERCTDAPPHQTIFGHLTLAQRFVDDAIASDLFRLEDTLSRLELARAPVSMASSTSDEYVRFDEVLRCREAIERRGRLLVLRDTGHMIGRSVGVAKEMARIATALAAGVEPDDPALRFPRLTETIAAASREAAALCECEQQIASRHGAAAAGATTRPRFGARARAASPLASSRMD